MSALFDERVVAVQPSLVRAVGSVTAAAVLQQIHYHAQAGHTRGDGWVVRTHAALGSEIGLTDRQVAHAARKLETIGVLESCQPDGYDRTKHYRVVRDAPALSGSSNRQISRIEARELPLPTAKSGATSSTEGERRSKTRPWGSEDEIRQAAQARIMEENAEREAAIRSTERAPMPDELRRRRTDRVAS